MSDTADTRETRYCAICDSHYPKGHFAAHKTTGPHLASLAQRQSMSRWYAGNAYKNPQEKR
jgi:hypothetical protein